MAKLDPKLTPTAPWARGYVQLTTQEAIHTILYGTHRGVKSFNRDKAMITLLRIGDAIVARGPHNRLHFQASAYAMMNHDRNEAELAELKGAQAALRERIAEDEQTLKELNEKAGERDTEE